MKTEEKNYFDRAIWVLKPILEFATVILQYIPPVILLHCKSVIILLQRRIVLKTIEITQQLSIFEYTYALIQIKWLLGMPYLSVMVLSMHI